VIRLQYNSEAKKIAIIIARALQTQQLVKIHFYNEDVEQVTGLFSHFDQETRRIKKTNDRGVKWLPLDDIVNVELEVD
jgi:hypothetical protein